MALDDTDRRWIADIVNGAVKNSEARVVDLITNVKESLENDIANLSRDVSNLTKDVSNLGVRFDNQAARLERHAGLLQTGNRWIARLNDWSAKVDASLEVKDKQIADLTDRINKLEQRNGGPKSPEPPPASQ
jgi:uncharacterized coiled-coil protein SlyX